MKWKVILFIISLILLFSGCRDGVCYEREFSGSKWSYSDSLEFELNISEINKDYNLILGLGITDDYPYRNLYLLFRVIQPDGKVQSSLSNFILMDNIRGEWYGSKQFFSDVYSYNKVISKGLKFPVEGVYKVRIIQFMRDDTLYGVDYVSLCIE